MANSHLDGYLAVPGSGSGEGVLVLHAWWGLNNTIKAFCEQLAQNGFVAFAVDMYHGKVAATIQDAEILGGTIDANYLQVKAEVAEGAKYLSEYVGLTSHKLAVIAFSLGGFFALDLSASDPERIRSVVLFYGTEGTMGTDFSRSRADYLGHFAENDQYETKPNVDNLEQSLTRAGRPVTFYRYPRTDHWFFEPDRPEYNKAAADLAWERTLTFLRRSTLM